MSSTATPRTAPVTTDAATAARFLRLLLQPGDTFEIRAKGQPPAKDKRGPMFCGFYTHDDIDLAADAIAQLDARSKPLAVWVTMNPCKPELLKLADRKITGAKTTTGDADILTRRWLLIDCDPERAADSSSNNAELQAAQERAAAVLAHLNAAGWPAPIQLMSGNGYHLLYRIDLPAADGGLVKRVLEGLHAKPFSDDAVKIDTSVFNAARITKLAGTIARKGPDTADRPHRRAELIDVPDQLGVVTREQLEKQAAKPAPAAIEPKPAASPPPAARKPGTGDKFARITTTAEGVREYLQQKGVIVTRQRRTTDATLLDLDRCPVVPDCTAAGSDISVIVSDNGRISYHNKHNRGQGLVWADVRDAIEPGYREHQQRQQQRAAATPSPARAARIDDDADDGPPPQTADTLLGELELGVLRALRGFSVEGEQGAALGEIQRLLKDYRWPAAGNAKPLLESTLAQHDTADLVLLKTTAAAAGITPDIDLAELMQPPPEPAQAIAYALRLIELQHTRDAEQLRADSIRKLTDAAGEQLQHTLTGIAEDIQKHKDRQQQRHADIGTLADHLDDAVASLPDYHGRRFIGLATGKLPELDKHTSGLRGLMMLCAEPGIGKTNLALQLGVNVIANEQDNGRCCCVFFSFEMSRAIIQRRLLARASGLKYRTLLLGDTHATRGDDQLHLSPTDRANLRQGISELRDIGDRITIVDAGDAANVTADWMHVVINRAKHKARAERVLVVIDNLTKMPMQPPGGGSWQNDIERDQYVIGELLELQQRHGDDPLLVIHEQNKSDQNTAKMNSAKGTATLGYRVDFLMFLQGKDENDRENDGDEQPVDLVIRKARDGAMRGTITLTHHHTINTFEPAARPAITQRSANQ